MLKSYAEDPAHYELDLGATLPQESPEKPIEYAKDIFCKYWADSRQGIELAKSLLKNPLLKGILTLAVIIGDMVQKSICGE